MQRRQRDSRLVCRDGYADGSESLMLHDFVTTHRESIISRTREKVSQRPWPQAPPDTFENGAPLFLTQLSDTLLGEAAAVSFAQEAIGVSATRHGGELVASGFNLSQVVHDYGDICEAVTELAAEQEAPITTREFHTLNRCLDIAIAEAVTEHGRVTARTRASEEVQRLGQLAHEIRNLLNTAVIAFDIMKGGSVAVNGSTGALLGRSLIGLRDLVDTTLSEVRMAANHQRRERVPVTSFLHEIAVAGGLHAEYRGLHFAIEPVDPRLAINIDPQLLSCAVMNLLNNAFKYTRAGGHVVLRAHHDGGSVCIEVEDECGGIPDTKGDPFEPFGDQRGQDRSGLGLGLSIARKAVRAHGGDIHIRNMPGKGCVFAIEVPLPGDGLLAAASA
jgi:signal transduction histidine kinase